MTNITIPGVHSVGDPQILVANTADQVYKMDRTTVWDQTIYWESASLNRTEDPSAVHTLTQLFLEYISNAAAGTLKANFTSDGGVNYGSDFDHTIVDTNGGVKVVTYSPRITGQDIRVKLTIPAHTTLRIIALTPKLVRRGNPGYSI